MRVSKFRLKTIVIVALSALMVAPGLSRLSSSQAQVPGAGSSGFSQFRPLPQGFVYYADDDGVTCEAATPGEAAEMMQRDSDGLTPIPRPRRSGIFSQAGLNIVLRGTQQLSTFPDAEQAFLRAAETWESLISSEITIVIDVDFGPTRFGTPFPQGVLGSTGTQTLIGEDIYDAVRAELNARAVGPQQAALYGALPAGTVPTNLGPTSDIFAPAAVFRAIGLISSNADPDAEPNLGPPPSIGFNSNFAFDFDPSDGIDGDKFDFDAVAVHEIGHLLGFSSAVGLTEMFPGEPPALTIWDIFRFRPGVNLNKVTNKQRILSSGGDQVFFSGSQELNLSTGRPNGTGGDQRQASHWKDDALSGVLIGIMDPTAPRGVREVISPSDLAVIDTVGFLLTGAQGDPGAPTLKKVNYKNNAKLIVKAAGFNATVEIEINGVVVSPPLARNFGAAGNKIKLKGNPATLNLQAGVNQVVLIQNGLRSNIFVLSL